MRNEFMHAGQTIRIKGGDIKSIDVCSENTDIVVNVEPRIVTCTTTGTTGHASVLSGFSGTLTIDEDYYRKAVGSFLKNDVKPWLKYFRIKKIQVNPKKNTTTVLWEDGTHTVVKRSEGDDPADIWSVVSYALAEKVYGSNSAFKREVKGKVQNLNEKRKP